MEFTDYTDTLGHSLTITHSEWGNFYYGRCPCGWESDLHYGYPSTVSDEIRQAYKYHR